jgi:uncharacterized protein YecE (DUF72 family)
MSNGQMLAWKIGAVRNTCAFPFHLDLMTLMSDDATTGNRHPPAPVLVGCAGWNVPAAMQAHFPVAGTHLQRYAAVFPAVEINTSFYRPHRPVTYARWRDSVPAAFRFAAKIPKAITHEMRLRNAEQALEKFISEAKMLEHKLGCLLVQLPPSLQYEAPVADAFFRCLRGITDVEVVCEPRHPAWFSRTAADLLARLDVAYVDADPVPAKLPQQAGAARTLYIRLHGSPLIYHSAYSEDYLDRLADRVECSVRAGKQVWCVFDNTASGAAVPNALTFLARLQRMRESAPAQAQQAH